MKDSIETNGEITVTWTAAKCSHCGICTRGTPGAFNIKKDPWINMEGASTEEIIKQVEKCPSEALQFSINQRNAA